MRVNVGSIAPCRRAKEEGWVSPDCVVGRLKDDAPFSRKYVFTYMKSEVGKPEGTVHSRGAVRRRLYYENLETVPVPVRAESEQWEALLECIASVRRHLLELRTLGGDAVSALEDVLLRSPPRRRRSPRSTTPTEPDPKEPKDIPVEARAG